MSTACPECGSSELKRATGRFNGGTMSTCVGYYSPPGHDHDNNCLTRTYVCENGHEVTVWKRRKCPADGCVWVGKESCSICCGTGVVKVDEWPSATPPRCP